MHDQCDRKDSATQLSSAMLKSLLWYLKSGAHPFRLKTNQGLGSRTQEYATVSASRTASNRKELVVLGSGWAAARLARDVDLSVFNLTVSISLSQVF